MHKEFNNKLPDIFHKYFNQQKNLRRYQTRHAEDYEIPHSKQILPGKQLGLQGQLNGI